MGGWVWTQEEAGCCWDVCVYAVRGLEQTKKVHKKNSDTDGTGTVLRAMMPINVNFKGSFVLLKNPE